jgi:hypothetical protein
MIDSVINVQMANRKFGKQKGIRTMELFNKNKNRGLRGFRVLNTHIGEARN